MASTNIHVDIVSAEREIFSGEADMVFAPAEQGELGIAPRHAPLITRLKPDQRAYLARGNNQKTIRKHLARAYSSLLDQSGAGKIAG